MKPRVAFYHGSVTRLGFDYTPGAVRILSRRTSSVLTCFYELGGRCTSVDLTIRYAIASLRIRFSEWQRTSYGSAAEQRLMGTCSSRVGIIGSLGMRVSEPCASGPT